MGLLVEDVEPAPEDLVFAPFSYDQIVDLWPLARVALVAGAAFATRVGDGVEAAHLRLAVQLADLAFDAFPEVARESHR